MRQNATRRNRMIQLLRYWTRQMAWQNKAVEWNTERQRGEDARRHRVTVTGTLSAKSCALKDPRKQPATWRPNDASDAPVTNATELPPSATGGVWTNSGFTIDASIPAAAAAAAINAASAANELVAPRDRAGADGAGWYAGLLEDHPSFYL